MRTLVIILGDQLNHDSEALVGLDPQHDCVWMAEVQEESTHVRSHKARILLFLSAMRNFCRTLRSRGHWIIYHRLGSHQHSSLTTALVHDIRKFRPQNLQMVQPGDYRVFDNIKHLTTQLQTLTEETDEAEEVTHWGSECTVAAESEGA